MRSAKVWTLAPPPPLTEDQYYEDYLLGVRMVKLDQKEYDKLVDDSVNFCEVEEALIDFSNEIRKAKKENNFNCMIFTEEAVDKLIGRIGNLTEGLKKATTR